MFYGKIISLNKVEEKITGPNDSDHHFNYSLSYSCGGILLFNPNRYKERSQGTYVLNKRILDERGYNLEAASQVTYVLDTQLNWADATIINGGAEIEKEDY